MPPKKDKKSPASGADPTDGKPLPPNIFLYIQLASVEAVPDFFDPLEIHLDQGGSLLLKCVEHYNDEGIITQNEFSSKPTFTLIFQQDNLDRINHAADNPLLIKLYMRKPEEPIHYEDEEMQLEMETSELLSMLIEKVDIVPNDSDELDHDEPKFEMILLSVGYLDIIKLFGHHRCMLHEQLYLYPVPDCPPKLRYTIKTEWHLYTLVPIVKEVSFTNMAFVIFESIYNLKDDYIIDMETLNVQLSFRSMQPVDRSEYHVIPWCNFNLFTECCIAEQVNFHVFEYFRKTVPDSCGIGLKSNMDVEMHRLFSQLMRSEDMDVNFDLINVKEDNALVCNTFHRYILTKSMSDTLFMAFAWRRYVIAVDVFNMTPMEKKEGKRVITAMVNKKIFSGVLDPAILLYPDVRGMRFAVELKYLGVRKKPVKTKPASTLSITNPSARLTVQLEVDTPTFAIINLCQLAPLGQVYEELKTFRASFISQNRLLFCKNKLIEVPSLPLSEIQRLAYADFDSFMRETIRYILDKRIFNVQQKRNHFCCELQNLTNILLKVIGSDFNTRMRTSSSVEFSNLCAFAHNELEQRIHNLLEKVEDEGLHELVVDRAVQEEKLMDHLNTIKIMRAVGDLRMGTLFLNKITGWLSGNMNDKFFTARPENSNKFINLFEFFDMISKVEHGEYAAAKAYFKTQKVLSVDLEYSAGWIHIYLDYVATRDDPEPTVSANANECLLNSITLYAEHCSNRPDGWILLYCYYKRFNYAPGYSYARWRLENYEKGITVQTSSSPHNLWSIMLNHCPRFDRQRSYSFYETFMLFVRLGLYEFAQVVWEDVQDDCSLADNYMISTQLKIFLNQLEEDFETQTFSFEDMDDEDVLAGFNAQLNGNVEYYRGNMALAAEFYTKNLLEEGAPVPERDDFLISKLRLAYIAYEAGDYQLTIDALNLPKVGRLIPLVTSYLMGKAYYKLDDISKAMEYFINCTKFAEHVPDVWGFLALINLQMGNNMNAISCWKYARADPTRNITDETIYTELDMIDIDSVDLYIDMVSPNNSFASFQGDEDED
ncbi:uncharacterized protein LOC6577591 [Drosophila mojavensis]|uniref:Tetratricopeptide repeat protein 18 n=1 Tax=Drosophila mojavensis TaxID=7230 RepID=B4KET8_DROMO|nr:uncharacterized protein LOC6577591 [Drosophila mojavensis]EDW12988.1 uncharacterized protein Dmoj_GI17973 [Drosophila mojavensis]